MTTETAGIEMVMVGLDELVRTEYTHRAHGCYWRAGDWVDPWEVVDDADVYDRAAIVQTLYESVLPVLLKRVGSENQVNAFAATPDLSEAQKVCGLFGLPFDEFRADAEKAKPEPKSWAGLNEDGSRKGAKGAPRGGTSEKSGG